MCVPLKSELDNFVYLISELLGSFLSMSVYGLLSDVSLDNKNFRDGRQSGRLVRDSNDSNNQENILESENR